MDTQFTGIIPARYASTRFPGKPLADLNGKPMIQVVYEHAMTAELQQLAVATDDRRIADAVNHFGGKVVMTTPTHPSGTDRCGEAAHLLQLDDNDVILNIQGDEPFISAHEINLLKNIFHRPEVNIATLVHPTYSNEDIQNPNKVKVVLSNTQKALYFSRSAIPLNRDNRPSTNPYYIHLGIYAYRYKTLKELIRLKPSSLEESEKLEQLRWLQNDYAVYAIPCEYQGIGIDTPDDLARLLQLHPKF